MHRGALDEAGRGRGLEDERKRVARCGVCMSKRESKRESEKRRMCVR